MRDGQVLAYTFPSEVLGNKTDVDANFYYGASWVNVGLPPQWDSRSVGGNAGEAPEPLGNVAVITVPELLLPGGMNGVHVVVSQAHSSCTARVNPQ